MEADDYQLPASTQVSVLLRLVQSAGGFATVLHKGSNYGSALYIVHRNGMEISAWEKVPSLSGQSDWRCAAIGEKVDSFLDSQRRFDPDAWILELDIPDPARFVPGFPTNG